MSLPETQEEAEVRERLQALRVDPAPGDFEAALHRRLAAAGPPDEPGLWSSLWHGEWRGRWFWPAVGVAAGVVVVLASMFGRSVLTKSGVPLPAAASIAANAPAETPEVEVPASKVAIIRLNLTTEVAANDAQIRVDLPEGLVFWSNGKPLEARSFVWTQALAAGDNDIPIAIRGQRPGRYRVTVAAQTGGAHVGDEVLLEVTSG